MKKMLTLFTGLLVSFGAYSQPSQFDPPQDLIDCSQITPECKEFRVIDMNNDGLPDIVTSHGSYGIEKIKVWYQKNVPDPDPVDPTGLVARWSFEDDSGADSLAEDTSPSGIHDGTVTGQTHSVPGLSGLGHAANFDGTGDYMLLGDHADWDFGTNDFTISGWFNVHQDPGSTRRPLLGCGGVGAGTPNVNGWDLSIGNSGNFLGLIWHYYPNYWNTSPDPNTLSYDFSNMTAGTWYHFTVVRNTTADTIKLYVNDVLQDTINESSNVNMSCGANYQLYIGAQLNSPNEFHGMLDEIRIYHRVLNETEICDLYEMGGGNCSP